ncbi:metal ABC transporter ATP-binding protein, partial [Staphylococcus aureus]|nr:metal ABC transporter ATP-binding protein [Staphylococcus aureus]
MNNILEIEGLTFRYEDRNVLENINLQVPKGAFLGLVGPNGSGKSTLLKCLLGVLKPKEGSIRVFGVDSKKFKEWNKVGYVSQKANSFNSGFPATVSEVVSMGLVSKKGLFRFFTKEDKKKVEKAIADVGMSEFQGRNIGELSGGQQQRLCIARCLAIEPDVILMDEPTSALDPISTLKVEELIQELKKDFSIVIVTHNMQQAARISDKTAFFLSGEVVEYTDTNKLFT